MLIAMWTATWLWSCRPAPAARLSAPELLSRLLSSPCSAELTERLVDNHPRRQLVQLWDESTSLLEVELCVEARLNLVVLREHLLRRLEVTDPVFAAERLGTRRPAKVTTARRRASS